MSFSEQLKKARLAVGLTQQEVADRAGITNSTYCGYETGKRQPDVEKIKLLASILQTSGDFLLETGFSSDDNCLEYAKKYQLLNEAGRAKADAYIDDLLDNAKYQAVGNDGLTAAEKERCSYIGREMGTAVKEILKDNKHAVFSQNNPESK